MFWMIDIAIDWEFDRIDGEIGGARFVFSVL